MENRIQSCIITLEKDVTRRSHAITEINKIHFPWSFINAIDGSKLTTTLNYDAKKGRRLLGFELTPGEIGCFLSHRLAWQCCVDTQINTLVLEDDFVFQPNIKEVINIALEHQELWEILRLQAMAEVKCKKIATYRGVNFFHNLADPLGTTAYIVKPSSAQILLKMSDSFIEPVDHFVENFRKHHIRVTAIKPYPINIMHTKSTIDAINQNVNRDERKPIRGWPKIKRSIYRNFYRIITCKSVP